MIEPHVIPALRTWNPVQTNLSNHLLPFRGQEPAFPSPGKHSSSHSSETHRWALVVDDVSDVTEMLSVLMTHAGYDVSTASSAQEAITLAREHHFDLVISDIGMPEMNGYELAQALRSLPGYDTVPMVAVTGYSMFDDRRHSLTSGFNEHVTKPIDPRSFLELIEKL
ncbi:MAG TPA: response regulator [Pyrinomonadaceae bacterium]|nr:response regulator [Pyrinomonadaceae bacterium]